MNRREILKLLAYTGVGLSGLGSVSSLLNACGKRRFYPSRLPGGKHGVTILVDGLRADTFKMLLDAGELPNIKKHLVDRGTLVETCVSTFPSTTGPAHLPFITGVMPGHNNCPGLRWIDRPNRSLRDYCTLHNVLFNGDFPEANHTLYEILHDQRTVCIFDFVSRGAAEVVRVPAKTLWFMLTGDMEVWERMDGLAVDAFEKAYLGGGVVPRYTFVWMPATDHLAHFHGSTSMVVNERVLDIDKQVGRIADILQRRKIYDKTLISLVVDHGLRDTSRHVDVRGILEEHGFSVLEDLVDNDNFNSLYQNNAARGVSGNSFALLYFAGRKEGRLNTMSYAWDRPVSYEELRSFQADGNGRIDLIDMLRNEQGIALVMARENEDVFSVFSAAGRGRIERNLNKYRYTVTGADPLGYDANPVTAALTDGVHHDKDVWFAASRFTDYPDGIFQIAQLFDSPRCGDVIITARDGWDLMDQGHVASHGGMFRPEIQVPCVLAGPGVKQEVIPIARTIDLYPTYLKFFGIPHQREAALDVFLEA